MTNEKLKTLNDLPLPKYFKVRSDMKLHGMVNRDDLKQLAIKWIKKIKIDNGGFDLTELEATECVRDVLKKIFNISEEDLK